MWCAKCAAPRWQACRTYRRGRAFVGSCDPHPVRVQAARIAAANLGVSFPLARGAVHRGRRADVYVNVAGCDRGHHPLRLSEVDWVPKLPLEDREDLCRIMATCGCVLHYLYYPYRAAAAAAAKAEGASA